MQSFTYATVEAGKVESSLTLNTVAEWTPVPVGTNQAVGVVTSIDIMAGDEISPGQVLYSVNLRPVVAARGDVPAFRTIEQGTRGADVAQLQQMLTDTGHYAGPVDGNAGARTVAAVREWQKSTGLEQTGAVEVGDVIFIPHLPSRVSLNQEIMTRGAALAGGEDVVRALPAAPSFTLPVTDAQAAMMATGTRVEITSPEGDLWEGLVTGQERDGQSQTTVVHLSGAEGSTVCADRCAQVPVAGESLLSSRVVTVEPTSGLIVPSAALVTTSDGTIAVIDETGARTPVTVVASARGMSVVEGVEAGVRVRIPGEPTS